MNNGWPQFGASDSSLSTKLKYLDGLKREIRLSLDKSMAGGKKKGKGGKGQPAAPEAPKENCIIAIGTQFPEMQQQILGILNSQQWDDQSVIQGTEYISLVRAAIPDKKKQGLAMKFAAFVVKEATEVGKEQALMATCPFDEAELISSNQPFLFDNMATVTNKRFIVKEDASIDEVTNGRAVADNALPGKPTIIFY